MANKETKDKLGRSLARVVKATGLARVPGLARAAAPAIGKVGSKAAALFNRSLTWARRDPLWLVSGVSLVLIIVVALLQTPPRAKPGPQQLGIRNEGVGGPQGDQSQRRVVGYFEDGWKKYYDDSFPVVRDNPDVFDEIVPFWHTLSQSGEIIVDRQRDEVMNFARENDIKVVPLINNEKNVDPGNDRVFTDPTIRRKAVDSVIALVNKYGYDGVNIDFEKIPADSATDFTEFIRMLASELRPEGKIISLSVFPKVDVPERIHGAHDYEALEEHIDEFIIMVYPHHSSGTGPGSLTPYGWVDAVMAWTVERIPREKITVALALYGYDWPSRGTGTALPTKGMVSVADRFGADIEFDTETRSAFFFYWKNGSKHEVWFEDNRSIREKLELFRKHDVALGFWRVNFEHNPDELWEIVRQEYLNK